MVEIRIPLEWEHFPSCSTFVSRAHPQPAVNSTFFKVLRRGTACLYKIESAGRENAYFSPAFNKWIFVLLSPDGVIEEAYVARLLSKAPAALEAAMPSPASTCGLSPGPRGSDVLSAEPVKIPFFTELKREMAVPGDTLHAATTRTGN